MHLIAVAFMLSGVSLPVPAPAAPQAVVRPARPAIPQPPLVDPDAAYHRRLILELCEVKPVFCGWTAS